VQLSKCYTAITLKFTDVWPVLLALFANITEDYTGIEQLHRMAVDNVGK